MGRAMGGLPILVTASTSNAVAVFFPTGQDTRGDGVPDWYKFQFYGTDNVSAAADGDGDGFTLLEEYRRDYQPSCSDIVMDGGISQRLSMGVFTDTRTYAYYWINSHPDGLVSGFGQEPVGTVIQTPNVPDNINGYIFGQWQVNGQRQTDSRGISITQATFTLYSNSVATAFFYTPDADSNANTIPDWWEVHYFGTLTGPIATSDPDGDGMTNLQEYRAGTDPKSAFSRLAITNILNTAEGWEISFPSVSGKVYRIEYATDLMTSNDWSILLDDITATGTVIQVVDPTATNQPARFYRVRLKR